jgi:hypothetical protein
MSVVLDVNGARLNTLSETEINAKIAEVTRLYQALVHQRLDLEKIPEARIDWNPTGGHDHRNDHAGKTLGHNLDNSIHSVDGIAKAGNLLRRGSSGRFELLAPGSTSDILQIVSGLPTWTSPAVATAHAILSGTHTDALAAAVVDGDIIIGNATPKWSKVAISIPAANIRNLLGVDNAELRPSWKATLDATNPTTIAIGDAAAPGTSLIFSHRDHKHGSPSTYTATAHSILSAIHGDTTPAAVVRGDLMVGKTGPVFARLPLGTVGQIPRSDGTDILWATPREEIFYPAVPGVTNQNLGDYAGVTVGSPGVISFTGYVPNDFLTLVKIAVVYIAGGISAAMSATVDYGAAGEAYNNHSGSVLSGTVTTVTNNITEYDVGSAFVSLAANDYFGITVSIPALTDPQTFLGVRLRYR